MARTLRTGCWPSPKANVLFILPNTYIEKTQALLSEFEEIALLNFASMWDIKFGESIDFVGLEYQGGLSQFLSDNGHLFALTRDATGVLYVSLVPKPTLKQSVKSVEPPKDVSCLDKKGLFCHLFYEDNYLWADLPLRKLLRRKFFIAQSAYELARVVNAERTRDMIIKLKRVFQSFPEGLKLDQLYRYLPVEQALTTFSVAPSISSMIDELPELFYRVKDESSGADVVFDGAKHTIADLTGNEDMFFTESQTPQAIATRAINSGLYQKTLMLIMRAEEASGLKINVWARSLELNYYLKHPRKLKRTLRDLSPLTFFLALARYNLVELRSNPEIKNDIRAFLPRRYTKYEELRESLPCLVDPTRAKELCACLLSIQTARPHSS